MTTTKSAIGFTGIAVLLVIGLAAYERSLTRAVTTELAAAKQKRDALVARISETENKLRLAERRAADAEKDSSELLKALDSVRALRAAAAAAASQSPASTAPIVAIGSLPSQSPDEQQRLAVMRAYQQALARKRAEDAKRRSEFDYALLDLDLVEKFNRRIAAAESYAARAEFQEGLRLFKQAMAEKPADVPVPDRVAQLQATLQAQTTPVDVTLISDGETFVSVSGQRAPVRFEQTVIGIPPGDYEVIGRRTGFRDVVIQLQVRNGLPPPVASVVCTQPIGP